MARTGTQTTADDGCAARPADSLAGQVVLIRRGTCPFHDKARNAQNAGAAGVVLYNNAPGSVNPTVAGAVPITIPVVMISQAQGNQLDTRIANGPVTMTWTDTKGSYPNSLGGRISGFSSYGLAPDLSLKPDIGAPGGSIYSTYPLEKGGYATVSGTSMASPHVAGTAALLLQAKPRTKASDVRTILQNTAQPKNWSGNPALGLLDHVHRQGAGIVQIDRAVLATTRVEPGKLSLGESEAGPAVRRLTIENNSNAPVTYSLSHAPALSSFIDTTTPPTSAYTPGVATGFASVSFSSTTVTVPAREKARVEVTITANTALPVRSLYGGYIVVTPQGGDPVRVPYAGITGDYQSMKILTPTQYAFPWLARVTDDTYYKQAAGAVYTMQDGDIPFVLAHLDHNARTLRIEVKDAATGQSLGLAFPDEEFLPKNSTSGSFFAFTFDGVAVSPKFREKDAAKGKRMFEVPDGQYVLVLSVLKPLGDERNPAHWETWTSPAFVIDRP